ncbi:hypothetical protein [Marivirga sericea]|nr:hypothetical protein [Marivirga sericea]
MSNNYLNIRKGMLFPFQFQLLGYILLLTGLAVLVINILASVILVVIGGFIVTAYSGTEFKEGHFRAYNAFGFMKFGEWQTLSKVEKLFIKKVNTSQKMYGRANQSSIIKSIRFKAFLKFENGNSILFYETKNYNRLKEKAENMARYLNLEIVDYSK